MTGFESGWLILKSRNTGLSRGDRFVLWIW